MNATDLHNALEVSKAQLSKWVRQSAYQSSRIDQLETALNRMILAHENLRDDTEGKYPPPDCGCIECTVGTVPDKYNTGLCAYHTAKNLLGQI